MKRRRTNGIKVLWAVDAFHEDPKTQLRALQAYLKLNGSSGASVQPVSILHAGSFDPISSTFPKNWHQLATAALDNLVQALENVAGVLIHPVRMLKVDKSSVSASVHAMIRFALEENASAILVSSSARKGIDRALLGSFAETLVLQSPVPVLIINPRTKTHQKITTLLYPTDFSLASKKGFDRVLSLAAALDLQILVFHKVPFTFAGLAFGMSLPTVSKESLRQLKKDILKTGDAWVKRGERFGVRTKFHFDMSSGPALDAITHLSKKIGPKGMIGMTSQSGKWTTTLLGSLTRQVLRTATCPVLVVHPDLPSMARRLTEEVRTMGYAYSAHPMLT